MPFTLTHVTAILPVAALRRRELPFSALAIGAMLPDVALYFPWHRDYLPMPAESAVLAQWVFVAHEILTQVSYFPMHSVHGLWTICLPLGMALFIGFQLFLKHPIFRLLPRWWQQRMRVWSGPCLEPSVVFFLGVSISIVFGAATHIFWDSFTHPGQWGTRLFPVLNQVWIQWGDSQLQGCRLLQHASAIVFLPILVVILGLETFRQEAVEGVPDSFPRPIKMFALVYVITVFLMVGVVAWDAARRHDPEGYLSIHGCGWFLNYCVTRAGFILLISAIVFGVTCQICSRRAIRRFSGMQF